MLQKCYEGIARAGVRARECALRVLGLSVPTSCELEAGELEAASCKLWLKVITPKTYKRIEFNTVEEMRAARKALNGKFCICEEHHGEVGQDGHWWTVYFGEEF